MTVGELSLHELVDLSLGTPEVVNYKGLRVLLLTIVDSLKLGDVKAQLNEAEKKDLLDGKDVRKGSPIQSGLASRASPADGSRGIQELERKVSKLENQLETLNSLPSNEDLMQRVKSHESVSQAPVSEMWQLMQVQKKAQANEEGVSKLMSMVEHLMGEMKELRGEMDDMKNQMNKFGSDITHLKEQMNKINNNNSTIMDRLKQLESASQNQDKFAEMQKLLNDLNNRLNNLPPMDSLVTWPAMEDALKGVYREPVTVASTLMQTSPMTDSLHIQTMPTSHSYTQTATPPPSRPGTSQSVRSDSSAAHPSREIQKLLKDIGELHGKHNLLEDRVRGLEELIAKKADLADVEKMIMENAIPEDLKATLTELKKGQEQLEEWREKSLGGSVSFCSSSDDLSGFRAFVEEKFSILSQRIDNLGNGAGDDANVISNSRLADLENQIQHDLNSLSSQVSADLGSQIKDLNSHLGQLEKLLESKLNQLGKKMQKIKQVIHSGFVKGNSPSVERVLSADRVLSGKEDDESFFNVDSETMSNIQTTILELQAEVEKFNATCIHLVDEHNSKQKHIDALYTFIDRLQENKADKEHVTMEIDVKADKRALENKISRSLFEGTVDELSRNLNSVMEKLSGHKSAWEDAVSELKLDVENKLDRMELDPLKAYLDNRIKSVSAKVVRKQEQDPEDAAGFRKQLIQKFHCISCDRPLDMTPQAPLASLPESKGLPGTRSGRPYTTFELEQIRAAQKSGKVGRNCLNFEKALDEKEMVKQRKQDIVAYLVHFKKQLQTSQCEVSQPSPQFMNIGYPRLTNTNQTSVSNHYQDVPDYFVTSRSCGGSHTLTHPHRRVTRLAQMSNIEQCEDISTVPIVNGRMETDIQGQDGHIYKARIGPGDMGHLPNLQPKIQSARKKSPNNSGYGKRSHTAPSPGLQEPKASISPRPTSARNPTRPTSSRPTSSRPHSSRASRSPTQAGADRPLTPSNTFDAVVETPKPDDGDIVVPLSSAPDDRAPSPTS